mgnify:CR=1 FL=1
MAKTFTWIWEFLTTCGDTKTYRTVKALRKSEEFMDVLKNKLETMSKEEIMEIAKMVNKLNSKTNAISNK